MLEDCLIQVLGNTIVLGCIMRCALLLQVQDKFVTRVFTSSIRVEHVDFCCELAI